MQARCLILASLGAAAFGGALPKEDKQIHEAAAHVAALEARLSQIQTTGFKATEAAEVKGSRRGRGASHASARINPGLSPVSDKKFFDGGRADYPTDDRPSTKDHFSFPFPKVQDSHDYASDYVKDENGDNGAWKAQAHYDELRASLSSVKDAADKAAGKEHEEAAELGKAQEKEKKATEEAAKQTKKAEEAHKQQEEAQKRSAAANSAIGEAEKLVKSEVTDLEDCKKQLEEAKAHLQKLVKDKEAAATKQAELDAAAADAGKEAELAKKEEAAAQGERDQAQKEHDGKVLSHAEQVAKMEKEVAETNAKLETAAKKLRTYRRDADKGKGQNGGVYYNAGCRTGLPRVLAAALLGLAGLRMA